MGTFKIVSTSAVKWYECEDNGFYTNGKFVICEDILSVLEGVVYDSTFIKNYLGNFKGKLAGGKMEYEIDGNQEVINGIISVIEGYINDIYVKQ